MHKKLLIMSVPFLSLMIIPFVVQAATISMCTFDKDTYGQGETGYITVTIYNDRNSKIRVTELTASINYYYTDGIVYLQKFFTDSTLPAEIQPGQSNSFYIPFSLPTNVASGYTEVDVKAKTQLWDWQDGQQWEGSDDPTSKLTLFIESPYKSQSEGRLAMIYLLGAASTVLAVAMMLLVILNRRARYVAQATA